ncbi:hypothetical protein D3C73_1599450 [compost metagenome]
MLFRYIDLEFIQLLHGGVKHIRYQMINLVSFGVQRVQLPAGFVIRGTKEH